MVCFCYIFHSSDQQTYIVVDSVPVTPVIMVIFLELRRCFCLTLAVLKGKNTFLLRSPPSLWSGRVTGQRQEKLPREVKRYKIYSKDELANGVLTL